MTNICVHLFEKGTEYSDFQITTPKGVLLRKNLKYGFYEVVDGNYIMRKGLLREALSEINKSFVIPEYHYCCECKSKPNLVKTFITKDKLYFMLRLVEEARDKATSKESRLKLRHYKNLLESLLNSDGDNLIKRLENRCFDLSSDILPRLKS